MTIDDVYKALIALLSSKSAPGIVIGVNADRTEITVQYRPELARIQAGK